MVKRLEPRDSNTVSLRRGCRRLRRQWLARLKSNQNSLLSGRELDPCSPAAYKRLNIRHAAAKAVVAAGKRHSYYCTDRPRCTINQHRTNNDVNLRAGVKVLYGIVLVYGGGCAKRRHLYGHHSMPRSEWTNSPFGVEVRLTGCCNCSCS